MVVIRPKTTDGVMCGWSHLCIDPTGLATTEKKRYHIDGRLIVDSIPLSTEVVESALGSSAAAAAAAAAAIASRRSSLHQSDSSALENAIANAHPISSWDWEQ